MTKRTLDGTLAVRVDQGAPIPVPDPNCGELGCRGKLEINTDFIEGLKHSRTISVEAMTRDISHQPRLPACGIRGSLRGPAGGTPKAAEMAATN